MGTSWLLDPTLLAEEKAFCMVEVVQGLSSEAWALEKRSEHLWPLKLQMSSVNPRFSPSRAVLTGVAEKRHQRLAGPAVPPEGQLPWYIK